MPWTVEYDNDTGDSDESFYETWTVTDGGRAFGTSTEADAEWLRDRLEKSDATWAALEGLLERYCGLVNSGDAGNWDPEEEREVIAARAALL